MRSNSLYVGRIQCCSLVIESCKNLYWRGYPETIWAWGQTFQNLARLSSAMIKRKILGSLCYSPSMKIRSLAKTWNKHVKMTMMVIILDLESVNWFHKLVMTFCFRLEIYYNIKPLLWHQQLSWKVKYIFTFGLDMKQFYFKNAHLANISVIFRKWKSVILKHISFSTCQFFGEKKSRLTKIFQIS